MTRCTSRTYAFVLLLLAAALSLPAIAQTLPPTFPGDTWEVKTPAELGMDEAKLAEAQAYALTRNGAGLITRNGYQVASWGSLTERYHVFSVTKGIGAVLLGIANHKPEFGVKLEDHAQALYASFGSPPANNDPARISAITIGQLATHTAGFEKDAFNPNIETDPGTSFQYSDGGANWLADVLTSKMNEDLRDVLKREVLDHLGITLRTAEGQVGDMEWRNINGDPTVNPRGTHIGLNPRREFNAGINANVDALARIGLLLERKGNWNGTQILGSDFIATLSAPVASIAGLPVIDGNGNPDPLYPSAPAHHGLFWWNNGDGTIPNVPTDAFWAWGRGDHLIVVIPSLQLVIARTSGQAAWKAECQTSMCAHYDALEPFLVPIVQSVQAPPPPPPGAPTVTLASDVSAVTTGGTAVLTWSSTLADSCSASSGWTGAKAVSGTETVTVSATTTYTLACTGSGGTTESSVSVTANPAPAPPPPPPPPPAPPPSNGGGGGGGMLQWWMLVGLLLAGGARPNLRSRLRTA